MKKTLIFRFCSWLIHGVAAWLAVGLATTSFASESPPEPTVLSVRNTHQSVVVSVEVPRGWQGIVLESSTNATAGGWDSWGFSEPVCEQGLIYFTYEVSTNLPNGNCEASAWLDVADYSSATNPLVRPPVNVPGQLAGVASNGAVLYLLANSASSAGAVDGNLREVVEACAYDGVAAYQVASLPLPAAWPCPVVVTNDTVYLGKASSNTDTASALEAWNLSPQGKFQLVASAKVTQPISALAVFGGLLAAEDVNSGISLFDVSIAGDLAPCGEGSSPNCLWFELSRATGALGAGWWAPLDDYGVARVPLSSASRR